MNKNLDDVIKTLKVGINPQEDFEKNIKYINAACGKESLFPPLPENPTFEELDKITNNVLIAYGKKSVLYDPSNNSDQEENIYTKYPEGPTDTEIYLAKILELNQQKLKERKKSNSNFKIIIKNFAKTNSKLSNQVEQLIKMEEKLTETNFNLNIQIEQWKVDCKEKSLENKKLKKYNSIMGTVTFIGVLFGILSYFK